MSDHFIKTCIVAVLYLLTVADIFQIIGSIVFIIYFLAMIKLKLVNEHYNGSWWNFIKLSFVYIFTKKKP